MRALTGPVSTTLLRNLHLTCLMNMKTFIIGLLFATTTSLYANEPGWTSHERAKQRQAVVTGVVERIEKVRDQPTANVHLMRATIALTGVEKGAELRRQDPHQDL
ncbi:MAG: hypothetical protein K9N23_04730 [Akkermansiaceae bacterium]|nr:hypothetical protein [Akkermansiaceae bacterium]MCF7730966.1 hypothetical protein [Akkermansiaceae bacterium]